MNRLRLIFGLLDKFPLRVVLSIYVIFKIVNVQFKGFEYNFLPNYCLKEKSGFCLKTLLAKTYI